MTSLALFAFFTGVHLALLQFSYFFLLLTNVTSTYITYVTIVVAWMMGTLLGLLLPRLTAALTLTVGVASYYAVYALVVTNPLAPATLGISALGVAVTGLWAGHFFVAMLPLFARPDRLFFHENNGFLVGIAAVFAGFAMLGRPFLLWTPLVAGAALLGHLRLLRSMSPAPDALPRSPAGEPAGDAGRPLSSAVRSLARRFASTMIAANLLLPAAMWVHSGLAGESMWRMFRTESNAVEWFSSVQLLLIALVAGANYVVAGLEHARARWIWGVLALGFLLFALDEQFGVHEAMRDDLFRPVGLFVETPWLIEGDVGLYLFFALGLTFAPFVLGELRQADRALALFVAAILLTFPTIVIDSLRDAVMEGWSTRRFWDYTFEEVGEMWAGLLFLLSFLALLEARLVRMAGPGRGVREAAT